MKNKWESELYCRGYLLTNDTNICSKRVGIDWNKWTVSSLDSFQLDVHEKETRFIYRSENRI